MAPFWTYILRCRDGTYYTGHTDDLEARVAAHARGLLPGYTRTRRPVRPAWSEEFATRDDAFRRERQIKGWSRRKKEALIAETGTLCANRGGCGSTLHVRLTLRRAQGERA